MSTAQKYQSELKKNNTAEKLWVQINNKIYDVTEFKEHPGTWDVLLEQAGKDASKGFNDAKHPPRAFTMMDKYEIFELPIIPYAQLKLHNTENDKWIAIRGKVYDISTFDSHPGGTQVLNENSGGNATEEFDNKGHSIEAKTILDDYYIGEYDPTGEEGRNQEPPTNPLLLIIPPIAIAVLAYLVRLL